jgi:hypothetical protein
MIASSMEEVRKAQSGPVAIGGVGGSGTRVVAAILSSLGFHIGGDLPSSLDNLWFTLLFKRPEALDAPAGDFRARFTVFQKVMCGTDPLTDDEIRLVRECAANPPPLHDPQWSLERADSLIRECSGVRNNGAWGWKEPNTHVVLARLGDTIPGLRYIHVVRNGLDIAYSWNQNQVQTWGSRFLGYDTIEVTPRVSLKYWVAVHRTVLQTGQKMGSRFLMVSYDRLCADPLRALPPLLNFLGFEASPDRIAELSALIKPPESIGRFKCHPRQELDPADIEFVETMGFDVAWPTAVKRTAVQETISWVRRRISRRLRWRAEA